MLDILVMCSACYLVSSFLSFLVFRLRLGVWLVHGGKPMASPWGPDWR